MNLDSLDKPLEEGLDYYREGQFIVFTEHYLIKRNYCCNSSCRHCPYKKKGSGNGQD
ncbi:MAG TPA: DUF5522 domain-containing protein [Saprospiraceae bacterium]|nr:DUF5522 domain-containing protein [Saprospiraceae bacterium]